jgi:hypothetical protein
MDLLKNNYPYAPSCCLANNSPALTATTEWIGHCSHVVIYKLFLIFRGDGDDEHEVRRMKHYRPET